MMSQQQICPNCKTKMVFAPDGRGLLCERCGYKQVVEREMPPARELARAQKLVGSLSQIDAQKETSLRISLRHGIGAAKQGERDEAFSHLERVLLSPDAGDAMRAEAWLWLSEVYADVADKRECLEQVLSLQPTNGVARRGMALLDGRLHEDEIVNPDRIERETPQEPREVEAEQFTCPKCASRMNYTPDGQRLRCEFCGFERPLNADGTQTVQPEFGMGGMEQDFIVGLARVSGHVQPVATRTLQCQGCGVEFVLAPETLSVTCPYCSHVYVTEAAETHEILPPQALIPFAVTEAEVRERLRDWFRQQKISRVRLLPLVGVYLPVWTFDLNGEVGWRGLVARGDEWVPASGSDYMLIDDHRVLGQRRPSKHLRRSLTDYDLDQLVTYDARYLADWPAQRYQLALADASIVARKEVLQTIRRNPSRLTNGQTVRDLTLNSSGLMVMSYKLLLLPMWMVHYEWEDKRVDLFVNGQNGRIRGEKQGGIVGKFVSWLRGDS
ncbi:MAG: hypothetical protein KC415_16260 [Anaerolineales bacterium]|nr:hypothetical protein [Anaerolineales bacterium]